MSTQQFPQLDPASIRATRDALHAYARVLGDMLKSARTKRKHWWHASLRPSLAGLTTGVIHGDIDVEIELEIRDSVFSVQAATGEQMREPLHGQPAAEVATQLSTFLRSAGVTEIQEVSAPDDSFPGYEPAEARKLAQALSAVSGAMVSFRAGVREEVSPIQVWPHHFDLSMIWLPGPKIPDQDPADEERADKQMNFGFVFGDEGIDEPYFYVTAYPLPDALPSVELPSGTQWKSDAFSGAVLLYKDLIATDDPAAYLQDFWSRLYAAGRAHLATNDKAEQEL